MPRAVPPVVHVPLAAAATIAIGTIPPARCKGTGSHRIVGWTWIALLPAVAVGSLRIPALLHFAWIHVSTLLTAIVLPLGIGRIRQRDVAAHARSTRNLHIGGRVIAGGFTRVPGPRLGDLRWNGGWNC